MDLQEKTRMQDTHQKLNQIIDNIGSLDVGLGLVWTWTWDIIKSELDYYDTDSEDWMTNPEFTEEQVFQMLWEDSDKQGFTLEYGAEAMSEHVFNWLCHRDIVVPT